MATGFAEARNNERNPSKISHLFHEPKDLLSNSHASLAETIVNKAKMRLYSSNYPTSHTDHDLISSTNRSFELHSSLSCENMKDVELTFYLLSSARMFSIRKFDEAEKLLEKCVRFSTPSDNALQRVVKLMSQALLERIEIEKGRIDLEKKTYDLEQCLLKFRSIVLVCEHKLPSYQVTQFTAVEAILESVALSKKIHLVDFGIRSGLHWSILIEALANRTECPVELLKITAIGTSKERLENTGSQLSSFAESMDLSLLFRSVVSEMKDLKEENFDLDPDEVVVVYSALRLCSLLVWPNQLKSFIEFIKKLNPCVVVVNEIDADTNASSFVDRFHEAFVFSSAMFDCLETCLRGDDNCGSLVEEVFFRDGIRNIVTAEDEERTHRHAKIGYWRKLFAEFGMVEKGLSDSSLYQACLLVKRYECWESCTIKMDGKCMIVGWKGTPLQSISAWKFDD